LASKAVPSFLAGYLFCALREISLLCAAEFFSPWFLPMQKLYDVAILTGMLPPGRHLEYAIAAGIPLSILAIHLRHSRSHHQKAVTLKPDNREILLVRPRDGPGHC
jgi:hypothetical protein